jgi:hypothetical protein
MAAGTCLVDGHQRRALRQQYRGNDSGTVRAGVDLRVTHSSRSQPRCTGPKDVNFTTTVHRKFTSGHQAEFLAISTTE